MSAPSALEQYMLELINAERRKAGAQPLAFDGDLNQAADGHSAWMVATDSFSHAGSGGSTPTQRMSAAGFRFAGSWASAENIAWASTRDPAGLQDEVRLLHANLMNSAGHRANILSDAYREIGIGLAAGDYRDWGESAFVTQNFARTNTRPFLTGVAFDDRDGDRFYDPGEGLAGIGVTAVSGTGARLATTTTASGGYAVELPAGTYQVTFSGGGYAMTRQVTIGSDNVKLDLVDPAGAEATGTAARDTLYGTASADTLKGLGGNDRMYGMAAGDRAFGGTGSDLLSGGSGDDRLHGESGRDVLSGDGGNDLLSGGRDADVFRFRGSWGSDRIADFQDGLDLIDLRGTGLSFAELSIAARDADRDGRADDVLIRANGQAIVLIDEHRAAIGASDFLF
ncbi:MAG TPA: CAP domain-containing protein [Microvirga sp.]|nr:CAP domain-containing protein [Microvirga sp.]